jgi:hypothetical protein
MRPKFGALLILLQLALPFLVVAQWQPANNPVAPAGCSAAAGTCVRIGYFACLHADTCTATIGSNEMLAWYRQRTTVRPLQGVPTYWVEAQQAGFFASNVVEINATISRVFIGPNPSAPLIDYMLLPFGSVWDTGMYLLEQAKIPSITACSPAALLYQCGATAEAIKTQLGCKEKNTRRFNYAHGLTNPGEQSLQPWIGQLKLRKAERIAIVRTSTLFYIGVRNGLVSAASDNHMAIVYDQLVPDNLPSTAQKVFSDLVALPAEQQPDGLAIITQDCVPWIRAMKAAKYAPKSVAAILCSDGLLPFQTLGEDLNYIVGYAQWAAGLGGSDYTESADTQPWAMFPHIVNGTTVGEPSPLQFQALFQKLIGQPDAVPGYAEAGVLIAPNMLEAAMHIAKSVDPELVNAQLDVFYQTSYYGLITTNRFGQNSQKQLVVNQRDHRGILQIISPASSGTADFIYPMPTWDEREYSAHFFATAIERAVMALSLACVLFTAGLMAYIFARRKQQIFQAAGLPFYMLMGVGCIVAYLSVLTWPVENNSSTCHSRIWLFTLAFHMMVDPILASSYRIATIFSHQLSTRKITNSNLGWLVIGLAAPQIILNSLWQGIAPPQPMIITQDVLRPAYTSFTTCQFGDAGVAFAGITLAYCCLLLLSAVVLAYRIRNAYAMFNDAQPIAASIFLFALVAAVVLVVEITLNEPTVSAQKVLFGLRSIGVLICYQGSIGMLFLRRIFDAIVPTTMSTRRTGGPSVTTHVDEALPKLAPGARHFHVGSALHKIQLTEPFSEGFEVQLEKMKQADARQQAKGQPQQRSRLVSVKPAEPHRPVDMDPPNTSVLSSPNSPADQPSEVLFTQSPTMASIVLPSDPDSSRSVLRRFLLSRSGSGAAPSASEDDDSLPAVILPPPPREELLRLSPSDLVHLVEGFWQRFGVRRQSATGVRSEEAELPGSLSHSE